MQETWSTSAGLDVHLDLSGSRPKARLESALRDAVRSGRLAAGTALPSSRSLARDLGVARNTVSQAYAQLVAEGWLSARHGSGTWVAQRAGDLAAPSPVAVAAAARGPRYDLRPGTPDLTAFPRAAWLAAARKALAAAPAADLGYADPRGLEVLRVALAEYLSRARGVRVTPDRVVVCAGFSQGLELVCEVLHARGTRLLAVESAGSLGHRNIAARAGLRCVPLPVDDRGAAVGELTSAGTGAVLLTPAHQFPLGAALAPERRRQVADWAAQTGGVVIEDDYDGEFRFDRQAVGALQPLAPEHVVYAGTASKSLAPGLRLGWLVLPAGLLDAVGTAKSAAGRLSSSLDQLALAELIRSGGYDRQVRRARLAYRRRLDLLRGALTRHVPEVRVTGIAAGLHAVVALPAGVTETEVVARAAARGLAVQGLADFRAGEQEAGPALVVGYAKPPPHAFSAAVARLCASLRDVIGA
ncbi:MAG TPA: PLP-dependent aminotransferase family protein [Streptosporangiaceae bacterium]|jgi:GntR family transcriptional regulator/MocR family aminotransferase